MANKKNTLQADHNDVVIIDLDKPRTLRLGHKALKRFSALTESALSDLQEVLDRYDNLTALIYVMLSEEDPELTPEKLDELLDQVPIKEISEKCAAAIQVAFPDEEAETPEDGETPMGAAGTGAEA